MYIERGLSFISNRQRRKEGTFCASEFAGIEPTPPAPKGAGYVRLDHSATVQSGRPVRLLRWHENVYWELGEWAGASECNWFWHSHFTPEIVFRLRSGWSGVKLITGGFGAESANKYIHMIQNARKNSGYIQQKIVLTACMFLYWKYKNVLVLKLHGVQINTFTWLKMPVIILVIYTFNAWYTYKNDWSQQHNCFESSQ